jgi:nucleoside-diphosphate kinase
MIGTQDRTLIVLKPDALERDLVDKILSRIEDEGLEIARIEDVNADRDLIKEHYEDHQNDYYYEPLVDWMSDQVIAGIVEGDDAAQRMRDLAGDTEPVSAEPGTIRGDLGHDSYAAADSEDRALHNLIHTAEPGDAEDELALWFD